MVDCLIVCAVSVGCLMMCLFVFGGQRMSHVSTLSTLDANLWRLLQS
jgi:hypothetical protein